MIQDMETFEKDGEKYGRDEHGEFKLDAGNTEPVSSEELGYQPCNAVLKYTMERYGEVRYCTAMAEKNFNDSGSNRCRVHKGRDNIMDKHRDNYKTGAFVQSYVGLFDKMEPHKRVVAIEMFRNLLGESKYDFDETTVTETIDTADVDWYEGDEVAVDFPIPQQHETRAKALWFATLEFIKVENIQEKMFEDAMKPQNGTTGEREVVITANEFGEVTDMGEHHLNLPLSRIIKDHKNLLQMGGVALDNEEESKGEVVAREWVVTMDEPEPKPEAEVEPDPFTKNVDGE